MTRVVSRTRPPTFLPQLSSHTSGPHSRLPMSKDKRALATKVVLNQILKKCNNDEDEAAKIPIFIDFVAPPKALALAGIRGGASSALRSSGRATQSADPHGPTSAASASSSAALTTLVLPHATYRSNGSTTVLIAGADVAPDCARINTRHKFFDAVVSIDSISAKTEQGHKQCLQVAHTFSRFVVDRRIVSRLPQSITCKLVSSSSSAATAGTTAATPTTTQRSKTLSLVDGLEETGSGLVLTLSQAAKGENLQVDAGGRCTIRVGHGASTVQEVGGNAKQALMQLKADFPMIYRFITEVRLVSPMTQPIRLIEVHLSSGR
jgi:hypothetical protein